MHASAFSHFPSLSPAPATYSRLTPSLDSGEPAGTLHTRRQVTFCTGRSDRSAATMSTQPGSSTQQHQGGGGASVREKVHLSCEEVQGHCKRRRPLWAASQAQVVWIAMR